MAGKKKASKKSPVTLEQLCNAAEDFNSFMQFEKPEGIPFDEMSEEELLEEITETAGELEEEDVITQDTFDTLTAMGVEFEATVAEEEEEESEEEELPTEAEIKKMKKAKLVELADELDVDIEGLKLAEIREALIEAVDDEEEEEEEEEETETEEEEIEKLSDEEVEEIEDAISKVKKSKKLDNIKVIAKENGIRIPPPFLKDIKKLKPYVTEKLEDLLDPKAAAEKAKAKGKKKLGNRKGGVGNFVRNILTESKEGWLTDNGELLEKVKKQFPDGNTNMQNIMWYRYDLKRKGLIPTK